MDFYAMKRKKLQKLCMKHGIRANLKNVEMAERLTLLLKDDEKPVTEVQSVEKNLEATEIVIDSVDSREVKKVKFSPDNETFYFVATDKDSDSDCDYNPKKKSVGKRKSIGKKGSTKQQIPVVQNAIEHEVEEIKETPVCVTRSRAQEMVLGDAEPIFLPIPQPKKVITGTENVAGKGVKPVQVQKQCKEIVLQKRKGLARDDTRKRTRNQGSSGASEVVPSVETTVENEVAPKHPLRRSRRKTTLFSSTAAEEELGICEAVETVKLAREPVNRKSSNTTEPRRRSRQNACKKVPAETGIEMDGLMKEMQEPSLLKESSLVVCESLNRSPVLQMGKELERDVTRKRPRNSLQFSIESVLCAEIKSPLREEPKINVGLGVLEAAGNENDADSCCNKEAVEKSINKRKGSSKKRESAAKDQPFSLAESAVYSEIEKTTDISSHVNGISSWNLKDADQENLVEQNPAESPDKLSSEVSLSFTSVLDVESLTNQLECEGKTSNSLVFNEGSETEELLVDRTINRKSSVLDDHLADSVITNVYEDQKSKVMVLVDVDSKNLANTGIETVEEMHLGRIFPSNTTLTPSNSSPVKKVGNHLQAQSTCMTEVPDETTSSWNAEMICNHDRTEEVVPADDESLKALDTSQTIPTGAEEVVHPDSHNTDGQVADIKLPDGVLDIFGTGTISVVLKSDGDAQNLSACGLSCMMTNDEYEQGKKLKVQCIHLYEGVEGMLHGSNNHNLSFDEVIVVNDHIVEPTVNSNHECAMDTVNEEIELGSPSFFVEKLSDENQRKSSKDSNIVVSADSEVRLRTAQSALQLDHMNSGDHDVVELTVKSNYECAMDTAKEEIESASPGFFVEKLLTENQRKSSKDPNIVVLADSEVKVRASQSTLQLDHMNSGDPDLRDEVASVRDINAFYKVGNASMNDNIKTLDGGTENRMMGSKADMEDDVTPTENNNIGDCLIGGDLVDLNNYDHGQVDIASINDSTVVILSADNSSTKRQVCSGDLYGLDDCSKDDEYDVKKNEITEQERDVNTAFEEDEENKEEATSKERTEKLLEVQTADLYELDDCSKDDKNDAREKEIIDEDRAFEEDEENKGEATLKDSTVELFHVQKGTFYRQ
ncbi:hypothetical protein M0R45_000772 [Rubus argutus]|uniref:Uncharacterized protein n=1 Tax=Rubus argutus TaxID=59490 RepID=A0AAW1VK08_RUBAR